MLSASIFMPFLLSLQAIDRQKIENGEAQEKEANAFVTFRVQNRHTVANVHRIQQEFLQKDWRFRHTFQSLNSLHVSLLFIHLDEANFINATEALMAALAKFRGVVPHLDVPFNGINHNGNASVYAALDERGESVAHIGQLHEFLVEEFENAGIASLNPFHEPFHAHATILYLGGEPGDATLAKYWPEEESKWHGRRLGTERVKVLQICNLTMDSSSQDYRVLFEAPLIDG